MASKKANIKNTRQHEGLRKRGRAAKIANAPGRIKRARKR
jgi:hypothetical protein